MTKKYSRVYVLKNPVATHSERAGIFLTELKGIYPNARFKVIETSPDGVQENVAIIQRIAKHFDEHTLVAISGGDGTVSLFVQAILHDLKLTAKQRQVAVLPMWGGNANDMANMLNGPGRLKRLQQTLEQAHEVAIYPLRLEFYHPHTGPVTRLACNYASFGTIAHLLAIMEDSAHARNNKHLEHNSLRMGVEAFDVLRSILKVPSFTIENDEKLERMYERIFVNGSRIARIERLPVRLNDRAYFEAVSHRSHVYLALYAFLALFARRHGHVSSESKRFIIKLATMAQIDGEVLKLDADTTVRISINETPFIALSSRLSSAEA